MQRSARVNIGNANKANNANNRLMSRRSPPTTSRFYRTPFANRSRTRTHTPTRTPTRILAQRREEKKRKEEKREDTPPPSPQGVNSARTRTPDGTIAATAAMAQGELPGNDREPFANVNPNAPGILPGSVREPFANAHPNANPYAHPNAETTIADKSLVIPEKGPLQLAPKRSPREDAQHAAHSISPPSRSSRLRVTPSLF